MSEHAKTKARDIVAGWPRGASCSKRNSADTQRSKLAWRLMLAGVHPFEIPYVQILSVELAEAILYERGQQAMTNAYRRSTRDYWPPKPVRHFRSDSHLLVFCEHANARSLSGVSNPNCEVEMWGCDQCASVFSCDPRGVKF